MQYVSSQAQSHAYQNTQRTIHSAICFRWPCKSLITPRYRAEATLAAQRRREGPSVTRAALKTVEVVKEQTKQQQGCQCPVPCDTTSIPVEQAAPHNALSSGPVLVAAGAFVCSFISLQVHCVAVLLRLAPVRVRSHVAEQQIAGNVKHLLTSSWAVRQQLSALLHWL